MGSSQNGHVGKGNAVQLPIAGGIHSFDGFVFSCERRSLGLPLFPASGTFRVAFECGNDAKKFRKNTV